MGRVVTAAVCCACVLLSGTARAADVRSAIFFYPWYSIPARDGSYAHWQQGGHRPPFDVASAFFPARGPYSSSDPRVLRDQMREIVRAGVDEVVASWWGKGSPEDVRLPAVARAARAQGLELAIHLEPYDGRTLESIASDLRFFRDLGIRDVYLYRAVDYPAAEWASLSLSVSGERVFAQTNRVGLATRGGFAGFYTYDILLYGGSKFERFCRQAHGAGLLCAPSVGPGYAAGPSTGDQRVKPRADGTTYDSMWRAALAAGADIVTITSYNEWSEGTQIEPAGHGGRYESYDGAYGLRGLRARTAYLDRTARWTAELR